MTLTDDAKVFAGQPIDWAIDGVDCRVVLAELNPGTSEIGIAPTRKSTNSFVN